MQSSKRFRDIDLRMIKLLFASWQAVEFRRYFEENFKVSY